MAFEFFKNAGKAVSSATETALRNREARLSTPAFKAEMAKEQVKLKGELGTLGDATWNALSATVVEGLLRPFQIAGKLISDKKYGVGAAGKDTMKSLGKIGWSWTKLAAAGVVVGGRLLKIGTRRGIAR